MHNLLLAAIIYRLNQLQPPAPPQPYRNPDRAALGRAFFIVLMIILGVCIHRSVTGHF